MVDMGFELKVEQILTAMLEHTPANSDRSRRQASMLSATMVLALECLARTYLISAIIVTASQIGGTTNAVCHT